MADTARLALPQPTGTDLVSEGDDNITQLSVALDAAAIFEQDVFASRPAAADLDGKFFLASDIQILYLSDGSSWFEVSRGAAEVPLGGMLDYAGGSDPSDTRFLLADGRAISRATYAGAWALWGTTYGAGNGTTTFNIPDGRGRSTVGPDSMGTAAGAAGRMAANNTRGASGGAETKTLATAELPAHAHAVGTLANDTVAAHTHDPGTFVVGNESAHTHGVGSFAVSAVGDFGMGTESADHTHSGTTGTENQAHNHAPNSASSFAMGNGSVANLGSGGTSRYIVGSFESTTYTESAAHNHNFGTGGRSAAHTHALNSHGHGFTGTSAAGASHTHTFTGSSASAGGHTHTISGSTANAGGATAFNQMGPYLVANKIVRVL